MEVRKQAYIRQSNLRRLVFLIYICLLLLSSCKLFKEVRTVAHSDTQITTEQKQGTIAAAQQMSTDQHFLEWKLDSSANSSAVQIWPIGKFKFSPELGFEGSAEKVLLSGNFRKNTEGFTLRDSTGTTRNRMEVEISGKKQMKVENKNTVKTETPAFWLMIGLGILVIAGVLIYKFLKP